MIAKGSVARGLSVLLALALVLAVLPPPKAHAVAVFRAAPAARGEGNCKDWDNACTLQTALASAVSGQEIWVAVGTHLPATEEKDRRITFQLKNGVAVYGGFAMTETERIQRNPAINVSILSGDIGVVGDSSDNSYHVVTGATGAILDGVTITAGNANGASPNDRGGGMYNSSSNPALTNVIFISNTATTGGGGMANESGSPILTNVTFSGNSAGWYGGGMANWSGSGPALTNVTFSGNAAGEGGGMYNYYNNSSPTLTSVAFDSNSATLGGGMYSENSSGPALMNVTFTGNTASSQGGGMYNGATSPTLMNVTFSANAADSGGGMGNQAGSSPVLTNVTFISNTASTQGGGMYNYSGSSKLTNATFTGNTADLFGGGMANLSNASPAIRNTIFWDNAAPNGAQIYNNVSAPIVSDSVVQGGCPSGSNCTTVIITTTPNLGVLGDYGGSTQTIPLQAGSSAIDTGNNATCATTDQRGITRPQGAACDIGAYEFVPVLLAVPSGQTSGLCENWANACELRYALTSAVSGQEIWAAAGTYKPTADTSRTATFQLKDGVALYGGFAGTETARTQRNPAANVTTLSGDIGVAGDSNDNSCHVVTGATGATLDGFTITAGNANGGGSYLYGAGIFNSNLSSPALTNVTFSGNSAFLAGGGMYNNSSSPTLTNVTFSGNSAQYGGGMYSISGSPTLTNVTFSGNSADYGGGMYGSSSSPALTNVTFSGNWAQYGGGMLNIGSSPALTNVTFSGNTATEGGGGLYNHSSSPTIRNTILWGNAAPNGAQIHNYDGSSVPSVSDSVVQGGCPSGSNCTTVIITTTPMLGTLGDYGGATPTIPLQAGSSAIDTGSDAACPATDQRGVTRPQGAHCDIGAYEAQTILLAVPGGQTGGLCESWTNACELRFALTSAVSGQEIWAAAGTYKPATADPDPQKATFQLKSGVALYGGFAMTETARSQRNPAANITILSGDIGTPGDASDNSYHVVRGATGATLDGFTVTAGNANSGAYPDYYGGGMLNQTSSPTLADLTFTSNTAQYGGGMSNFSSSPTLTNVTFSGNSATEGDGGGMRNYQSSPLLTNVTFSGNWASYSGGGVYNGKSSPILTNVTFSENSAQYGGGIHNWDSSSPSIRNTIFWGNVATIWGAQVDNANNSTPSVSDSVVQGGYAGITNIIIADPMLGALGNYGGSTQTVPLLPGSSAINATSSNCPATDQRGVLRSHPTCDIGAYEVQSIVYLPLTLKSY
jgi:hypothetical protein